MIKLDYRVASIVTLSYFGDEFKRDGTKRLNNQPCDVIKMRDYPSLF